MSSYGEQEATARSRLTRCSPGNSYEVVGIIDDDAEKTGGRVLGVPVVDFSGGLLGLANGLDFDGIAGRDWR